MLEIAVASYLPYGMGMLHAAKMAATLVGTSATGITFWSCGKTIPRPVIVSEPE